MFRALVAVVVILLGLAWFVLDSLDRDARPAAAGSRGSSFATVGADELPLKAEARPGTLRAVTVQGAPAAPPARAAAGDPGAGDDATARTAPDVVGASLGETLARAQSLLASGDRQGAEALLRRTMAEVGSAAAAARAGLSLARIVGDPAERRALVSRAFREGVVIGAEYEEFGAVLRQLNADPGSSLVPLTRFESYTVQGGDALWNLCNRTFPERFGIRAEVGLVRLVNGLVGDGLRPGQRLMVPHLPLTIRVDSEQHGLVAFLGDVAVASYRVGLGQEGRTPKGSFRIAVKQENPTWWKQGRAIPFGDPENVLGTRWLGFEDRPGTTGYGIHGTTDPDSIGKDRSMGCVRLRNEEVQELFELVPRGAEVTIL